MWQYLFLQKAIDCPIERKAYCCLYHICFGSREEFDEWIELNQGREKLEEELRKLIEKEARAQARKVKKMKVLEGEDGIQEWEGGRGRKSRRR
jgi:hypothetical protein